MFWCLVESNCFPGFTFHFICSSLAHVQQSNGIVTWNINVMFHDVSALLNKMFFQAHSHLLPVPFPFQWRKQLTTVSRCLSEYEVLTLRFQFLLQWTTLRGFSCFLSRVKIFLNKITIFKYVVSYTLQTTVLHTFLILAWFLRKTFYWSTDYSFCYWKINRQDKYLKLACVKLSFRSLNFQFPYEMNLVGKFPLPSNLTFTL